MSHSADCAGCERCKWTPPDAAPSEPFFTRLRREGGAKYAAALRRETVKLARDFPEVSVGIQENLQARVAELSSALRSVLDQCDHGHDPVVREAARVVLESWSQPNTVECRATSSGLAWPKDSPVTWSFAHGRGCRDFETCEARFRGRKP